MNQDNPGAAWGAVLAARAMLEGSKRKNYTPGSNKILIALMFWEKDRDQAVRLARYLADLEPTHTDRADLLLVNRFDCPKVSSEDVTYLSRKFNTFTYQTPVCQTGWPMGCTAIWAATTVWAFTNITAKMCPAYKAIFFCEADGAPCVKNWLECMSNTWDAAERLQPTYVAGPMVEAPGISQHINGNCLVSGDPKFLDWLARTSNSMPGYGGWDYVLAQDFKKWGWANFKGMRSYYNTPAFSAADFAQFQKEQIFWMHGDKSGCLVDFGRAAFLK